MGLIIRILFKLLMGFLGRKLAEKLIRFLLALPKWICTIFFNGNSIPLIALMIIVVLSAIFWS